MKKLDQYFKLQEEIYDYFGYVEDWVSIPIDDARDCYWTLHENSYGGGSVLFSKTKEEQCSEPIYSNDIYTQRFLSKWVYRAKDFTMICVDTHTDGNKFLQIFDNTKEIKKT